MHNDWAERWTDEEVVSYLLSQAAPLEGWCLDENCYGFVFDKAAFSVMDDDEYRVRRIVEFLRESGARNLADVIRNSTDPDLH
jgi:hypothetical protein